MAIDGRILDTDNRFYDYCLRNKIKDPFQENYDSIEWKKNRDKFLRLEHTFRLWDFHFWMDWETFIWYCKMSKNYADISIYLPCDCAERQCNIACAYFGEDCLRQKEEIKTPEILGFEGRWEFKDDNEPYS